MRESDKESIANKVVDMLRETPATFEVRGFVEQEDLIEKIEALQLENKGLRTSLESVMKGEDGLTLVSRVESSPQGLRIKSLGAAVEVRGDLELSTAEDFVTVAKTFEEYLSGRDSAKTFEEYLSGRVL